MAEDKPIVFSDLVASLTQTRTFLGESAGVLSGEKRAQFDSLLKIADEQFESFKTIVPECVDNLKTKFEELKRDHEQNVADFANAKAKFAEVKEKVAAGEFEPQPPPEKPVAPQLGSFLRDELLSKYGPAKNPTQSNSDVAWRDWNLDGSWIDPETPQS